MIATCVHKEHQHFTPLTVFLKNTDSFKFKSVHHWLSRGKLEKLQSRAAQLCCILKTQSSILAVGHHNISNCFLNYFIAQTFFNFNALRKHSITQNTIVSSAAIAKPANSWIEQWRFTNQRQGRLHNVWDETSANQRILTSLEKWFAIAALVVRTTTLYACQIAARQKMQ